MPGYWSIHGHNFNMITEQHQSVPAIRHWRAWPLWAGRYMSSCNDYFLKFSDPCARLLTLNLYIADDSPRYYLAIFMTMLSVRPLWIIVQYLESTCRKAYKFSSVPVIRCSSGRCIFPCIRRVKQLYNSVLDDVKRESSCRWPCVHASISCTQQVLTHWGRVTHICVS